MYGLTDYGEEFFIRKVLLANLGTVSGISIGLYDESTDSIADSDDEAAISTEPSGTAYSRVSKSVGTTDFTGQMPSTEVEAVISDHSFDVSDDTSGSLNAYFIIINFAAEIVSDDSGSQTNHLVATGALAQAYDLSEVDTINNIGAGISQD